MEEKAKRKGIPSGRAAVGGYSATVCEVKALPIASLVNKFSLSSLIGQPEANGQCCGTDTIL